jgi:E3 ubiquitin-protein ligase SHPRH
MKSEVYYLNNPAHQQRSRRFTAKYEVKQTPLVQLDWWRIILDEAQMIEGKITAASKIAASLTGQHKWCD